MPVRPVAPLPNSYPTDRFSFKNSRFCLYMASRRDYRREKALAPPLFQRDLREPMLVRSRKSRIFTGLREFFIEKQAVRS